ncbi:MAG TPA: dUTP diphosphatase [Blastocatellia bacterium]|nr:dUTP diphosphatase [Blastocatellia bacterium]
MSIELRIKRLDEGVSIPKYQHEGDAGLDLASRVDLILQPRQRAMIPTGLALAIPKGCAGFVLPRSGLAARNGIAMVNAPGLIDSGYRGEVTIVLINTDEKEPFTIRRGDRIAQLVVQRIENVSPVAVDDLDSTPRGAGGFGSTGVAG